VQEKKDKEAAEKKAEGTDEPAENDKKSRRKK